MITIEAIASYIPDSFEDNLAKLDKFGVDEEFMTQKIGIHRVSRMAENEEASDLCIRAFAALQDKTDISIQDVDFILAVSQIPDINGMPNVSAIVHGKLGAVETCAAIDLNLGCSGYVYALSVAKTFMEAHNLSKGLLFTCDPYSKIIDPDDFDTALIFGDAATVTLLSESEPAQPAWTPRQFLFGTNGKMNQAINNSKGTLAMDGRTILFFVLSSVPGHIRQLLEDGNSTLADIDLFVLHQGSKYMVDGLTKKLGIPPEKVPYDILNYGNTGPSSIPLIFEKNLNRDDIKHVLFSGFGIGVSVASCLLERLPPLR